MLIDGLNHVAVLTSDADRLVAFYAEMFGATVDGRPVDDTELQMTVRIGERARVM